MATITLKVKVVPSGARDQLDGWLGDRLKVRVRAPPERGKANAAVARLLAERLGIAAGAVSVVRGHASREKAVAIEGISETELKSRLAREPEDPSVLEPK